MIKLLREAKNSKLWRQRTRLNRLVESVAEIERFNGRWQEVWCERLVDGSRQHESFEAGQSVEGQQRSTAVEM